MPSTSLFYAHSLSTSGSGTGTNVAWTVSETFTSTNPVNPFMASTPYISYNEITNYLIIKDFTNVEIPVDSMLVGFELFVGIQLTSVSDTVNMESVETYLQYNGSNYGDNLALNGINSDWGYSDFSIGDSSSLYGLTLEMIKSPSFGLKISGINRNNSEQYSTTLTSATLKLYYTSEFPKFIYNGDTTSEVTVTLDLNPAVTNPTTAFGIFHGNDTNLISRNPTSILSYTEYSLYTEPDSSSPDPSFNPLVSSLGTGIGSYPNNYLSTTPVNIVRGVSGLWGSDTTTSHTMSYNLSSLIENKSYRRGLVLWYKATDASGNVQESGVYDILFFNINVINTTGSVINPHFLYNGDTTSEIFVTVDINIEATNPTTTFQILHGDPDTSSGESEIGYTWGNNYTGPSGNDPSGGYIDRFGMDLGQPFGTYVINYLSTPMLTSTLSDYSISNHTITYNKTDLIAGNTYRRGIALIHSVLAGDLSIVYRLYDVLYVNLIVVDTTVPQYPKFIYNNDSTSQVNVTLDLNIDSTNPTIDFGVFHGDVDLVTQYTPFGYRWGNLNINGDIINGGSGGKFTPPNIGDPDYSGYIGVTISPPTGIYNDNNILNTELRTFAFSTRQFPYCCRNTTIHTMEFDTSGLIAGNTYFRGMCLENTRSYPLASQGKMYDIIYFNISVIDTTPEPEIIQPFLMYNGDTTAEVFVTIDLNPKVTKPTTTFSVYHGDPDTSSSGTDLGYTWGQYFTDDGTSAHTSFAGNYLSTPITSSTLSDGTVTDHTMSYLPIDSIDLIVGETYRRGLVLWNIRSSVSKLYDILWFNINVIDTTTTRRKPAGSYSNLLI